MFYRHEGVGEFQDRTIRRCLERCYYFYKIWNMTDYTITPITLTLLLNM